MLNFNNRFSTKLVSIILIFTLLVPLSSVLAQEAQRDYYGEGEAAAQIEYNPIPPFVGGVIAGFTFLLSEWYFAGNIVGYLIIRNMDVEVPIHHTANFDRGSKSFFERGYKDYVKKSRASKFNMGGGVGFVLFLLLLGQSDLMIGG